MLVGGPVWQTDVSVLTLTYVGDRPGATIFLSALTQLGGWPLLSLTTLIATFLILIRKSNNDAVLLVFIIISGRFAVELQKFLVSRHRPDALDQLVAVHSASFPSGHAANATITYLAVALLAARGRPIAMIAAFLLAGVIGISRVALGVHWPSDVAGGWAFGIVWTFGLFLLTQKHETQPLLQR